MPSRNLAGRAGRWSATHRKTAILGWLLFVVLATVPRFDWSTSMQVKLALIVVYVGFAVLVFRSGTPWTFKIAAWAGGLVLYLYVTTVAVLQHPLGDPLEASTRAAIDFPSGEIA